MNFQWALLGIKQYNTLLKPITVECEMKQYDLLLKVTPWGHSVHKQMTPKSSLLVSR